MNNKVKISTSSPSSEFKVLSISGNVGDVLEKHKVNDNALLLVRSGKILYSEKDREQELNAGDSWSIPADVLHKVTCIDESEVFVVLSTSTKMRFEK